MDSKLRNDSSPSHSMAPFQIDPIKIGRMVESIDNLTGEVRHMREDIKELREDIRRKPDMSDVERKLHDYGFDDPKETKKDAEFVRRERLKHESNTVIVTRVKQGVALALILGALGWIGNAALDQIREDVQQEQHP